MDVSGCSPRPRIFFTVKTVAPGEVICSSHGMANFGRSRFEPNSAELSGSPRHIADQVGFWSNLGLANFSVSTKGVLAYSTVGSDLAEIAILSREGKTLSRVAGPDSWFSPRLSRNGELMAIARTEPSSGRSSLWLLDFSRGRTFEIHNWPRSRWISGMVTRRREYCFPLCPRWPIRPLFAKMQMARVASN